MELKKGCLLVFFLIGIVFCLSLISAETAGYLNVPNVTENGSLGDFRSMADKTLSEQIVIPSNLEAFTKYLFALDNTKTIDLQTFIIYIAFWIMLLLLIKSALEMIPIFGDGWKAWLGSLIVTILASSSGGLKAISIWFFSLGKLFKQTSFLWLVFDFLILVLLFIGVTMFLKKAKSKMGEEKARAIGMKTSMP